MEVKSSYKKHNNNLTLLLTETRAGLKLAEENWAGMLISANSNSSISSQIMNMGLKTQNMWLRGKKTDWALSIIDSHIQKKTEMLSNPKTNRICWLRKPK